MRLQRKYARAGFTLIELLVVIGLILVLVGITVSISYSGLIDGHKTVGAGDRASGWLLIARSKAQREGAPRGVRFIINGTQIKEAQYLEVPEPYIPRSDGTPGGPRVRISEDGAGNRTATLVGADLTDLNNNIANGDTLSLSEFGVLVRLDSAALPLVPVSGPNTGRLPVNGQFLPQLGPSTQFSTTGVGFIRKARPMLGEPILQLTGDNAIDFTLSSSQVVRNTVENSVDILFAPNGEVLNTTLGRSILWVRNTSFPSPVFGDRASFEAAGQMSLIVIYSKTGAIATQPVTLPPPPPGGPSDPFAATKDGFNTGL